MPRFVPRELNSFSDSLIILQRARDPEYAALLDEQDKPKRGRKKAKYTYHCIQRPHSHLL